MLSLSLHLNNKKGPVAFSKLGMQIAILMLSCLPATVILAYGLALNEPPALTTVVTSTKPTVLYISRSDCHFCHLFEEEILKPLIRSGEYADSIIIRNLVLDSAELVAGFDGKPISTKALAQSLKAELTPTLLFIDAQGQELAPRIVGYQRSEFYFYYFEETIQKAIAALNSAPVMPPE